MIKINLLPHKRVKTVEKGVIKIRIVAAVLTIAVLLVCLSLTINTFNKKSELDQKLDETTARLAQLKAKVKEVENFENSRKELEAKLKTIKDLEKRKIPYTLLLNELNAQMTKEVWLTSLSVTGPSFTLEAMSRDNRKNAETFLHSMESSPVFSEVKLVENIKDMGNNKFSFKVTGKLAGYENALPPAPPVAAKAAKGSAAKGKKPAPVPPATPAGK